MAAVNPYLNFNGNCEEAFNFYKAVFGKEFQTFTRFGEMEHRAEGEENKVMHVALPLGKDSFLFGSDRPGAYGKGTLGDLFFVAIAAESEAEADNLFKGLSEGGQPTMPMNKAPWNAYFGMLTDQYGVSWLINYDYAQKG
ncbi:VOC family protein [Chitinophaga sp. RCC_12]|uniref:VOC family protein n=1 Tax=Chitinophaga sp. RCC_12 TaxID=3239226 RepID=UPI0035243E46